MGGIVENFIYNKLLIVPGGLIRPPFCVAMWSTGKDVQKPASAQLLPCLMGTGFRVGVAVGSLLHIEIQYVCCMGMGAIIFGRRLLRSA